MAWNAVDIQKPETIILTANAQGVASTGAIQLGAYYDMTLTFATDGNVAVQLEVLVSNDPDGLLADAKSLQPGITLGQIYGVEARKTRYLKYWVRATAADEGDLVKVHLLRWRQG